MNEATVQRAYVGDGSLWFKQEARLAAWVLSLSEVMAWYEGGVLQGFALKRRADDWRLVVKMVRRRNKREREHLVAFFTADDAYTCFQLFAAAVRSHAVLWVKDKYAPTAGG